MNTLGRGSQGHRGGRAGRGGGGSGGRGGGRRHRPVKVEQPSTQQTLALPPPLPFSNGAAASTDAPTVATTTTTKTPRAHQTRPQQQRQQNSESFRHLRKVGGNNAHRGRTDSMAAK